MQTHNGIVFRHNKNENFPFAVTEMGLEDIVLSEISQTEKDKYCIDITCMWNLKKKYNILVTITKRKKYLSFP